MYFYGKSDKGRKRPDNQDCCRTVRLFANCILCVVCDGMGGAQGGNIASEIAANLFTDAVSKKMHALYGEDTEQQIDYTGEQMQNEICRLMDQASQKANAAVFARAAEDPALAGMGTTLVAAMNVGNRLFALNIGDSRLYRINENGIRKLTKDHSYVQYLIDVGEITEEEAADAAVRNVITRSVGTEERVRADLYVADLKGKGFLMLCSDGLTNYTTEEKIRETVMAPPEVLDDPTYTDYELEDKVEYLIGLANEGGGGDNITVVLMKYGD